VFFLILLGIDLLAAAVIVYFFLIGIADGSVSSFNIGIWLAILAGTAAILGGGMVLKRSGRRAAANVILSVLALPSFLSGLFLLAVIVLQPRWN
jgi:hypothetical protein